jgi:hypothetical protein
MLKGLFDGTRKLHKAGLGGFLKSENFDKSFYKSVFNLLENVKRSPVIFVSGNHAEVPWFIKENLKNKIVAIFVVLDRSEFSEQKILFSKCAMEMKTLKLRVIIRDSKFSGGEVLRRWAFPVDLGIFTSPKWREDEVLKISSNIKPGGDLYLRRAEETWQKHLVRDRLRRAFVEADPVSGFYHFRRW